MIVEGDTVEIYAWTMAEPSTTESKPARWFKRHQGRAKFVRWGVDYSNSETCAGSRTAMIVLMPDGFMQLIDPELVREV